MNWIKKLLGWDYDPNELHDKYVQAHNARVNTDNELPVIKAESARLVALARRNHFGEALMLGMKRREGMI